MHSLPLISVVKISKKSGDHRHNPNAISLGVLVLVKFPPSTGAGLEAC